MSSPATHGTYFDHPPQAFRWIVNCSFGSHETVPGTPCNPAANWQFARKISSDLVADVSLVKPTALDGICGAANCQLSSWPAPTQATTGTCAAANRLEHCRKSRRGDLRQTLEVYRLDGLWGRQSGQQLACSRLPALPSDLVRSPSV